MSLSIQSYAYVPLGKIFQASSLCVNTLLVLRFTLSCSWNMALNGTEGSTEWWEIQTEIQQNITNFLTISATSFTHSSY
jgi:hypothetical protein